MRGQGAQTEWWLSEDEKRLTNTRNHWEWGRLGRGGCRSGSVSTPRGTESPPDLTFVGRIPSLAPLPPFPLFQSHARGLCDPLLFSSFPRGITTAASYLLISGGSFHTPDHTLLL